jgi:hypothetical protein
MQHILMKKTVLAHVKHKCKQRKLSRVGALVLNMSLFVLLIVACQPTGIEPIAEITAIPDDVVVEQVIEERMISQEIVQTPEFDQCLSSGGFEQFMRFSQLSGIVFV